MFKIAWSTVPRTAAKIGRGGRTRTGTGPSPADFEAAVSTHCTTPRKMVRTEGVAPSRAFAHQLLGLARMLFRHIRKMEHPPGRAPGWLPYRGSPSLSTGWMREMVEAEGFAPS